MIKFLKSNKDDIKDAIMKTSDKTGYSLPIVEKDLWVCYILDYLFNRCYI
ncbi:MAG: hypothetical protein LBV51_02345 [Acholeplasmatales bacterium]|jgi:hypothetical protein|nr:hypothetical protein [Acholeplasmatales bacterium]